MDAYSLLAGEKASVAGWTGPAYPHPTPPHPHLTHTPPTCAGVVATTSAEEACQGVDVAVMVGGFPRKVSLRESDLISLWLTNPNQP